MNWILFILGASITLLTAYDLVNTTFAPRGSSIISGSINKIVWGVLRRINHITPGDRVLRGAGVIMVLSYLLTWVLLLWGGNALIFISFPEAVINSSSYIQATAIERLYYVGYLLSTLGNGDFKSGTDFWMIYSAMVSFLGLMLITISITYMVPVLSAVTDRRALSIRIAAIGQSPQRMLLDNWNGKDFSMLNQHLQDLATSIARQSQLNLAYPVLHYFHHGQKKTALLPNLVALDEALSLLLLYVPEDKQPGMQYLKPVRASITAFLLSLNSAFIKNTADVPPLKAEVLKQSGVPVKEPNLGEIQKLGTRRRLLNSILQNAEWEWDDLDNAVFDSELDFDSLS